MTRSRKHVCAHAHSLSPPVVVTQSVSSHNRVTESETHSASCPGLHGSLSYRDLPPPRGHRAAHISDWYSGRMKTWPNLGQLQWAQRTPELATQRAKTLLGPPHNPASLFALSTPLLSASPPSLVNALLISLLFQCLLPQNATCTSWLEGRGGGKLWVLLQGKGNVQGTS